MPPAEAAKPKRTDSFTILRAEDKPAVREGLAAALTASGQMMHSAAPKDGAPEHLTMLHGSIDLLISELVADDR